VGKKDVSLNHLKCPQRKKNQELPPRGSDKLKDPEPSKKKGSDLGIKAMDLRHGNSKLLSGREIDARRNGVRGVPGRIWAELPGN